jgi:hypothetical protein
MPEPRFVTDTPDAAARRRARQRAQRIEARAIDILENDPEVSTMKEARAKAREIEDLATQVDKGLRDPSTGRPTSKAPKRSQRRPSPGGAPHRSSRSRHGKTAPLARRTRRAAVAPFGSAVSAGWTFFTGGLSLVMFYVVLRSAGAISSFTDGLVSGLDGLTDPSRPLLPSKGEAAPPPPSRRTVVATPRGAVPGKALVK